MASIVDIITSIAQDNNLNAEDLIAKYAPPAQSRRRALVQIVEVSSAAPPKCSATTAKGKPCAAKPLSGTCLCRVHTGRAPAPTPAPEPAPTPAPRRAPASRRPPPPVHTHELDDQVHDTCELCQSHGNTLAKPEGEEEYETVSSPVRDLRERLEMLATEDDFEDEEA